VTSVAGLARWMVLLLRDLACVRQRRSHGHRGCMLLAWLGASSRIGSAGNLSAERVDLSPGKEAVCQGGR